MPLDGLPAPVTDPENTLNWEWLVTKIDEVLPPSIDLDPTLAPATQTNWSTVLAGLRLESTGAQNAEIGWDVTLTKGTWTLTILTYTGPDEGIITASLNGVSIGTIDLYTAGAVDRVNKSITGISVTTTGKKRLLLKMATKNAASTNYYGELYGVGLRRTA